MTDLQTINEIFELTRRPATRPFSAASGEALLADTVLTAADDYPKADIVLLGFEDGPREDRSENSVTAAAAIREDFYRLTNFGIRKKIFDLGDFTDSEGDGTGGDDFRKVVRRVLDDQKKLIVMGGTGRISYQSCLAMGDVFGADRYLAINVDSRLAPCSGASQEKGPSFRNLLEDQKLVPGYFYEIAFQPYFCPPAGFRYLQNKGAKLVSLEQIRSRETADLELRELIRQEFIHHSSSMSIFFNFSMNALRSSDAPGVTNSSPFGLRAGEFLTLVQFSAKLVNTRMVQFTEVDAALDIAGRTSKLVAIAMHRFCSSLASV